ncbi:hypothetical protein [Amycolatopsis nigrescens]|uniref:hypothetical protein n=1 Tax=Amycolatopsis nigrescens TaxID=381445 RepID=UPI0012F75CF8|nr:hypothetical protein [Amycolatopsis nigrescens]
MRRKGDRAHEYTERVDDMGFCLEHRARLREQWLVRYATACAHDYLRRVCARPGSWVVSVYRGQGAGREHLVTVRTKWTPEKYPDSPVGKPVAPATMGM